MKIIFIFIALSISGCGAFDRAASTITGGAAKVCVDGVMYLQFTSGATVAYLPNGQIRTCQ